MVITIRFHPTIVPNPNDIEISRITHVGEYSVYFLRFLMFIEISAATGFMLAYSELELRSSKKAPVFFDINKILFRISKCFLAGKVLRFSTP